MEENKEQISNTAGSHECYDLFNEFITKISELLKSLNSEDDIQGLKTIIENTKEEKTQSEDRSDEENKNKGKEKPWLERAIEAISNEDENKKKLFIYALWLWYMPISNIPASTKNENLKKVDNNLFTNLSDQGLLPFRVNGLASYGQGIVHMKNSILFLLDLFKSIKSNYNESITKEDIKTKIKRMCSVEDTSIKNMLLHLCDQNKYEPIANYNHKEQIVKVFSYLLDENEQLICGTEETNARNIDEKIQTIKNHINNNLKIKLDDFYQDEIRYLWMNTDLDNKLSDIQLLEYKKAMVLYGPPGTGKTYRAKLLANSLVKRYFINKGEFPNDDEIKKHIDYLQFHINYNYEEFIAGQTIEDSTVKTKKGFIFNVIDKAKQAPDVPYVVILDEMNRTDVSRVFGELFTAIEKRGEDVLLSFPDPEPVPNGIKNNLILNLPENIYFIGTMNEIDFSLERIDFALRRRFIWQECGYSAEDLKEMIYHFFKKTTYSFDDNDIVHYCNDCTTLNEMIKSKMNETYHIGHSFFAEIVNIYSKLKDNCINDKAWPKAKNILWQISIKPTLDAYCGTMPEEEKKQVMPSFENAFFPEKQQKKNKSK